MRKYSAYPFLFLRPLGLLCIACTLLLTGCELFHLGATRAPQLPDADQKTPYGMLLLFKTELDNNNIAAATRILAKEPQTPYLAIEKYELRNEIERFGRRIAHWDITSLAVDTLSPASLRLRTEFNYIKEVTFTTAKMNDLWFIVSIEE